MIITFPAAKCYDLARERSAARYSSRSESGIALIIVMISILVLAVLAGGFAYSMKVETILARNANSEAELEWLGRSGVEYARWILAQQMTCPAEPYDALTQVWAGGAGGPCSTNGPLSEVLHEVRLGHGSFTWKITDGESKYNINAALAPGGDKMLEQALIVMGVDATDLPPLVGAMLDWMDGDDSTHLEGAESEYYQTLSPPYEAKNGPIDDLSELLLVRGITQDMYWGPSSTNHPISALQEQQQTARFGSHFNPPVYTAGLVDIFTPISAGKININTASATVLQLIPGVDAARADAIVSARGGEDDGSGITGPYRSVDPGYLFNRVPGIGLEVARQVQRFCDVRSRTFQVQVDAKIGNYTRQFIAVLGRNNPRDIQILTFYWK